MPSSKSTYLRSRHPKLIGPFNHSLGSCNVDMNGIYIFWANRGKVYVVAACD